MREDDRAAWRDELGINRSVLPDHQPGGCRCARGLHSAKLVLYSADFHEVEQLQHADGWNDAASLLAEGALLLQGAGAEFVVLCTDTMHRVAPDIESRIEIPLLHIADSTAHAIRAPDLSTIGLLGTRFTMEQDFYRGRLETNFGLSVHVPCPASRDLVHDVIYDALPGRHHGIVAELPRTSRHRAGRDGCPGHHSRLYRDQPACSARGCFCPVVRHDSTPRGSRSLLRARWSHRRSTWRRTRPWNSVARVTAAEFWHRPSLGRRSPAAPFRATQRRSVGRRRT